MTRDLDFNDDDSYSSTANRIIWTMGDGWQPIGYYRSSRSNNPFVAIFEGNGFTISNLSNLTIDIIGTDSVGLFGYTQSDAEIANVGLLNVDIAVPRSVGSLVGRNEGTITNSYWDIDTSGIQTDANGESKTTIELQEPMMATGIYSSWSTEAWDFGTSRQYPVLNYIDNPDTDSSECRSADNTTADLPVCGSLLSPTLRYGLSELQLVEGNLSPDFDVVAPSYRGTVVSSASTIQFRSITVNPDAKIYITTNGKARHTAIDSGDESSMISLNTNGITMTFLLNLSPMLKLVFPIK